MTVNEEFGKGIILLQERSEVFKLLVEKLGVIRFEKRNTNFQAFAKIIISQQLSAKAAENIFQRVCSISAKKKTELNPKDFIKIEDDQLKDCGVSKFKARFIRNLAKKFIENPNFTNEWVGLTDTEAKYEIKKLDGFGEWSSGIVMLFYFGRLNIFPQGDATLIKAHKILFNCCLSKSLKEIDWAIPFKGVLALYYWRWVDSGMMGLGLEKKYNL